MAAVGVRVRDILLLDRTPAVDAEASATAERRHLRDDVQRHLVDVRSVLNGVYLLHHRLRSLFLHSTRKPSKWAFVWSNVV